MYFHFPIYLSMTLFYAYAYTGKTPTVSTKDGSSRLYVEIIKDHSHSHIPWLALSGTNCRILGSDVTNKHFSG